jgi:ABC-type glutathione transport system ATPase component
MVGRASELAELGVAWSRLVATPAAGPRTAVVTGEAGSGKSLLVSAALEALDPAPRTVLSGRARIHSPAPYDRLAVRGTS